jgi:hypothetical protein
MSKAANHYWYGEASPWTEQQLEDNYDFKKLQSHANALILDRENPPQLRSARTVHSED